MYLGGKKAHVDKSELYVHVGMDVYAMLLSVAT